MGQFVHLYVQYVLINVHANRVARAQNQMLLVTDADVASALQGAYDGPVAVDT
jgi:hypothetical protein